MQVRFALKLMAALWLLSACVTINVYFPAAAAEQAADRIIEDVWGDTRDAKKPAKEGSSSLNDSARPSLILLAATNVLEFIIPAAHAQQPDINIATPAIRQITQSMEARHANLKKYYDAGAVGLTSDGLVEVRDLNLVALPERTAARKLVADENTDRNNLYREIAAANNHPEWEADIRKTFAQRWVQRAAAGWYYQDGGAWKQK
jgi:uncharacterized protein YdbL (DUF1318 family)